MDGLEQDAKRMDLVVLGGICAAFLCWIVFLLIHTLKLYLH